ncbi:MAG: hypothetical protein DME26_10635 [Verrucomicrobia bacterium]|nr:MAG: hypothetical protein DME26_10635 [Verrucomicrobiota bacterium]
MSANRNSQLRIREHSRFGKRIATEFRLPPVESLNEVKSPVRDRKRAPTASVDLEQKNVASDSALPIAGGVSNGSFLHFL